MVRLSNLGKVFFCTTNETKREHAHNIRLTKKEKNTIKNGFKKLKVTEKDQRMTNSPQIFKVEQTLAITKNGIIKTKMNRCSGPFTTVLHS